MGPRDYFVWKGGGLFFGKFYIVIFNKFEFSEGGGGRGPEPHPSSRSMHGVHGRVWKLT